MGQAWVRGCVVGEVVAQVYCLLWCLLLLAEEEARVGVRVARLLRWGVVAVGVAGRVTVWGRCLVGAAPPQAPCLTRRMRSPLLPLPPACAPWVLFLQVPAAERQRAALAVLLHCSQLPPLNLR